MLKKVVHRSLLGLFALFAFSVVSLVLGLPLYGLVGTLRTGEDPLAGDVGAVALLSSLGLGALGVVAGAGLFALFLWSAPKGPGEDRSVSSTSLG